MKSNRQILVLGLLALVSIGVGLWAGMQAKSSKPVEGYPDLGGDFTGWGATWADIDLDTDLERLDLYGSEINDEGVKHLEGRDQLGCAVDFDLDSSARRRLDGRRGASMRLCGKGVLLFAADLVPLH